jgi:hypothetical protein
MDCPSQYRVSRRLIRWIGFDHNPLRRRSDRIQTACRVVAILAMLVVLPITIVIGAHIAAAESNQAHSQAVSRHQVNAVTTAVATGSSGYYESRATAPVRWTDQGVTHKAVVDVDDSTPAGTVETIWVDTAGHPTVAPLSAYQAIGDGIFTGLGLAAGVAVVLVVVSALVAVRLNHVRQAEWEAEWERIDPGWAAGRRS